MAQVGIVMGSDSDMPVMAKAADILEELGISYEMTIISAHRAPDVFFDPQKEDYVLHWSSSHAHNGFGNMGGGDFMFLRQIGDGAGHFDDAGVAAHADAHFFHCPAEQLLGLGGKGA